MPIDLEPVSTPRRAESVAERLRTRILSGDYPPGSRLPNERALADTLAVNRASVREALKRLEFLELIEVRHGQGSFVREIGASSALQLIEDLLRNRHTLSRELLRQILEFRRHITLHVVELAATHRSETMLARARAALAREASSGGDPAVALEVDVEMNALLGEATGNLMYQFLTNLFTRLLRQLGPIYYNDQRDHERSLATHRELLNTVEARDPAAARRIVERMLDYSERAILAEAERLESAGIIGPGAGAEPT